MTATATDEYGFAESLIAEAVHRVADPTLVPDDEWIKLVLREAGLA